MRRINRNILYLGLVSFFRDMSSEMSFPILPLFLYNILGAPAAVIGLIDGVAESVSSVLKTFSGYVSDKIGRRKPLVVAGYALSSLTQPIFAIAGAWQQVLGGRVLDRIGKGIRDSPRDALIAAAGGREVRGGYFGVQRALDTAGAALGNILAFLVLFYVGLQYRTVFWIAFIPGLIAVIIVMMKVKDVVQKKKVAPFKISFKGFSLDFKKLIGVVTLFSIGHLSYSFFVLRAQNLGVIILAIPIVYLVYNIFYASFAYHAGVLSDKIGRKKMLIVGYFLFAFTTFAFAYINSSYAVWLIFALYGAFMAITQAVTRAYVADLAPPTLRGTALGIYHTTTGLALLPAGIIAGLLWDFVSPRAPFFFASAIALLSASVLFSLRKS